VVFVARAGVFAGALLAVFFGADAFLAGVARFVVVAFFNVVFFDVAFFLGTAGDFAAVFFLAAVDFSAFAALFLPVWALLPTGLGGFEVVDFLDAFFLAAVFAVFATAVAFRRVDFLAVLTVALAILLVAPGRVPVRGEEKLKINRLVSSVHIASAGCPAKKAQV